MKSIEVIFSPDLYDYGHNDEHQVVVLDILRATTAMTTAIYKGVKGIIPVAEIEDLKRFKENGYLIASEREGIKVDFADFGNSPFTFIENDLTGKTIAYSTTNGTIAIEKVAESSSQVLIGAYTNISILCDYLIEKNQAVVLLCSGWKGKFSLEDAIIAGAYCEKLIESGHFSTECDSAYAAMDLWSMAKKDIMTYVEKCSHRKRLRTLELDNVIEFCFTPDTTPIIPIFKDGIIQKKQ